MIYFSNSENISEYKEKQEKLRSIIEKDEDYIILTVFRSLLFSLLPW
jgi:hypothetical protein